MELIRSVPILTVMIQHLAQVLPAHGFDVPVVAEVPADRPPVFLLVDNLGGETLTLIDQPRVLFQWWSTSKALAQNQALTVQALVEHSVYTIPDIKRVETTGFAYVPDPDSKAHRFQFTSIFTVKRKPVI